LKKQLAELKSCKNITVVQCRTHTVAETRAAVLPST
jgi:hypothetical protein